LLSAAPQIRVQAADAAKGSTGETPGFREISFGEIPSRSAVLQVILRLAE
jgi:hypothetical protein